MPGADIVRIKYDEKKGVYTFINEIQKIKSDNIDLSGNNLGFSIYFNDDQFIEVFNRIPKHIRHINLSDNSLGLRDGTLLINAFSSLPQNCTVDIRQNSLYSSLLKYKSMGKNHFFKPLEDILSTKNIQLITSDQSNQEDQMFIDAFPKKPNIKRAPKSPSPDSKNPPSYFSKKDKNSHHYTREP